MKKITLSSLILAALAVVTLGLTQTTANAATTWQKGTPKALRGTWYYNGAGANKAYVTYSANMSKGQYFEKATTANAYYKLEGYGLKRIKYRSLGKKVYQLTGIQYSPRGVVVKNDGQRVTYKVKVLSPQKIYFYTGLHTYAKKANFKIVKNNQTV